MRLTKEQKEYILKHYPSTKNTEILKALPGINNKQMVNFAIRNGLRKSKDFRQDLFTTPFTKTQDELLKHTYPTYSKEELLKLFPNFGWNKIVRRAAKIGVKRDLSYVHKNLRVSRDESAVQQKRMETCLKKYGVEYPLQNEEIKDQVKKNQIKSGSIKHILSDGETVYQFAERKGINASQAYLIYKAYGEEGLLSYYENYQGPSKSTLEHAFEKMLESEQFFIERYNRFPSKLKYKPDYKILFNNTSFFINVDGLYYHAEHKTEKSYHFKMREAFANNQQTLFQFREDEIREKPEIIKSIVRNYFGIYSEKIFARKCTIKKVSSKDSNIFWTENHLMGPIVAPTFGLYYQDKLVMAISVKRKKDGIDIARLCSQKNTLVLGGFSKLIKHIEKLYEPKFIQSFVDLRYATGHSYAKQGYQLESITLGFHWTDFRNTFNRLKCRAKMDSRNLTQAEQAKEFGWVKIYDAGQAKYIKHLTTKTRE